MGTLTVKLPPALEREISQAARRRRITKSELVRRAAQQFIARDAEPHAFRSALELAGSLVGCIDGTPGDLATNPRYMDDFGK